MANRLPGPADDAVISVAGITITHSMAINDQVHSLTIQPGTADTLNMSAGSLTLAATSTIAGGSALDLAGGTFGSASTLSLNGPFMWTGGTLNGGGAVTATATTVISGNSDKTLDSTTLTTFGPIIITGAGTFTLSYATWNFDSEQTLINESTFVANGNFNGKFLNDGVFKPGIDAGRMKDTGGYAQTPKGSMKIDIGGNMPATGYDQLETGGKITLNGPLVLQHTNSFVPKAGDTFVIIKNDSGAVVNGTFAGQPNDSNLPPLTVFDQLGNAYRVTYRITYNSSVMGNVAVTSINNVVLTAASIQYPSSTVVTASANPASFGQAVTFTAKVSAIPQGVGTPTGTVDFREGATDLTPGGVAVSGGLATFSSASLPLGAHTITASYSGDVNFLGSSGDNSFAPQMINQDQTTTALSAFPNPAVFGQPVTFTAAVVGLPPGAGTPTGAVVFSDGSTPLSTVQLNSAAQATFSISTLSPGGHTITASYGGDIDFLPSSCSPYGQTMQPAGTVLTLAASTSPASFGQPLTFTAAVSPLAPGSGTPTGSVVFKDLSTLLGSATLDSTGQATFSTSSLAPATHAITAAYQGDTNFSASGLAIMSETVAKGATMTTLTSAPNPAVFGQTVIMTAVVTTAALGTATGTVTFTEGSSTLAANVAMSSGQATLSTSTLAVGNHTITATYNGDSNFQSSMGSAASPQTVNKAPSSVVVRSSPNSSAFGQAITFTASVTAGAGTGTPTGTVTFQEGSATLAANMSLNGSGQATFTTSSLVAASHTIAASYSGDTQFLGNSGNNSTAPQVVNPDPTATFLTAFPNPAVFGQAVTFTAAVKVLVPWVTSATGSVTFADSSTLLAIVPLNSAGRATYTTSTLSRGGHAISASYSRGMNFLASSYSPYGQAVQQAATAVTLVSNHNPAAFGQPVTFTATVHVSAPGAGIPTGAVVFNDVNTPLGSVAINSAGQATFSTSMLAPGSHAITAAYLGNINFVPSGLTIIAETVLKGATATTLSIGPNPSIVGQPVTMTAVVHAVAPAAGTPSGAVSFKEGTTLLGTAPLQLIGGADRATFTTSALAVGAHTIAATYGGDSHFSSSTSSLLMQTVQAIRQAGVSPAVAAALGAQARSSIMPTTASALPQHMGPAAAANAPLVLWRPTATELDTFFGSTMLTGAERIARSRANARTGMASTEDWLGSLF
jgi:hypothetical protein